MKRQFFWVQNSVILTPIGDRARLSCFLNLAVRFTLTLSNLLQKEAQVMVSDKSGTPFIRLTFPVDRETPIQELLQRLQEKKIVFCDAFPWGPKKRSHSRTWNDLE